MLLELMKIHSKELEKDQFIKKNICQHSRVLTATISETTCNMIIERSLYQYINSEATCLPIKRDWQNVAHSKSRTMEQTLNSKNKNLELFRSCFFVVFSIHIYQHRKASKLTDKCLANWMKKLRVGSASVYCLWEATPLPLLLPLFLPVEHMAASLSKTCTEATMRSIDSFATKCARLQ